MTWRPLLGADAIAVARGDADAIVAAPWEQLAAEVPAGARPDRDAARADLARGRAGGALLLDELGRGAEAGELLQGAIDVLGEHELSPGLLTGYTGIAWAAMALGAGDELCAPIDAAVLEMVASPWRGSLDLIDGLVGIGAYLLARGPAARGGVAHVVRGLAGAAQRDDRGATWLRDGHHDLGMAHGNAGVIAWLARACEAGVATDVARPLLDDAVRWLLAFDAADRPVRFPGTVAADGARHRGRHGWCYGDLGIASALYGAGARTGRADWSATALGIAHTAAALPRTATTIHDASLCHGTAGCAHMFARLYHASGDRTCEAAARAWLGETMAHAMDGFVARDAAGQTRRSPGLLAGATGVALALVAAAGDAPPAWDALLLL